MNSPWPSWNKESNLLLKWILVLRNFFKSNVCDLANKDLTALVRQAVF